MNTELRAGGVASADESDYTTIPSITKMGEVGPAVHAILTDEWYAKPKVLPNSMFAGGLPICVYGPVLLPELESGASYLIIATVHHVGTIASRAYLGFNEPDHESASGSTSAAGGGGMAGETPPPQ